MLCPASLHRFFSQLYDFRTLHLLATQDFGPGSAAPYNLFSHMALLETEWDGNGLSPLQRYLQRVQMHYQNNAHKQNHIHRTSFPPKAV